jgi:uncharacterized protein (TIGR03083 family)
VLSLTDAQLQTVVPGCPLWTVKGVVSHLTGLTADVCSGRLEGAGTPAWAQAQVDERASVPLADVVQEWTARGPGFEASLPEWGFRGWVFTYDVTMHGDDVREALGLPLPTSETHAAVLDGLIDQARRRAEGFGALALAAGDRTWMVGEGEPVASLTAPDEGELGRVLGGRRSDDAVRAMAWTGDPEPWLPVLPLFRDGR